MKHRFSTEAKVGIFVALSLLVIGYLTFRVSDLGMLTGGYYEIYAHMKNAEGVTMKTPVQMAGIGIGVVTDIQLTPDRQARVQMKIKNEVKVPVNVEAQIRIRGVLGDTYIELIPEKGDDTESLAAGAEISRPAKRTDYQDLFGDVSEITQNVKDITESLKVYTAVDNSRAAEILKNMEVLTANMAKFSSNNMANMDVIVSNLRALTTDLRALSGGSSQDIEAALERIANITEKIDKGEGTIGQLVSDDKLAKKANKTLDNINDITGGFARLETEIGWHMEYLTNTNDVKNYVSLALKPRPDKYFLFEVVYDPAPPGSDKTEITTVTANGATSVIETTTEKFDKIRFSAQLAKVFKDVTVRGGLIESTGGVGVDYNKGPFSAQFSAYDFGNSRPHLKLLGSMNIFPSVYILTGLDDFISSEHGLDWFVGAGIRLNDNDVKSLVGGASLAK